MTTKPMAIDTWAFELARQIALKFPVRASEVYDYAVQLKAAGMSTEGITDLVTQMCDRRQEGMTFRGMVQVLTEAIIEREDQP